MVLWNSLDMNSPIEESAPDTQALRSDVKETKQVEARGAVPVSCSCASGAAGSVDLGGLEVLGATGSIYHQLNQLVLIPF